MAVVISVTVIRLRQGVTVLPFHVCSVILQKECGFEYTSKLQCMFQDTSLSKDLNDNFKSHIAATMPLQGIV